MGRSTLNVRIAGGLVAAAAFAFVVMTVSGVGQDVLGTWWVRCGGRFSRHDCAEGEIPWAAVLMALMIGSVSALVAFGDVKVRRAGVSVRARLEVRRASSVAPAGVDTSGSVPPPPRRPTQPPAATEPTRSPEPTDVDALARRIGL